MLKLTSDPDAGYIEITVDGAVGHKEYEAVVAEVDRLLARHERLNIVEIVREIGWIEAEVWWKDIAFHLTHRDFLGRVAVVSDQGWVGPLTRMFAPLFLAPIRVFPLNELDAARRWVRDGDPAHPLPEEQLDEAGVPHPGFA